MRALHTPQQETNVAYNPGVSYRGGEFIAQGISQAGNAISSGISGAMAQFTKNREERDYMDERMKSVAANLAQFRDFETDAADDKSPAGTLLNSFANWDNKPLAAKKAALVDADHLISKGERNLERARAEQFQLLAVQDRQAAAENLQKHQADMLGVSRQGMALEGMRTLGGLFNQSQDNARAAERLGMDRQNFANLQEARRAKLKSDTLMAGNLANFQRLAAEPTGPSRMGGDAAAALLSQPGTRLPDFSRYGPQDTQLTRQPLSLDRVLELGTQTGAAFHPNFDNYAKLYQGRGADADHVPRMVNLGGVNTIYSPKGGQFQLAPNSSLPDDLPEVPGHTAVPNGKGGVAYIPNGELTDTQRHARFVGQERVLLNSISRAYSEEEKTGYRRQLVGVQQNIRNLESGGAKPASGASPPPAAIEYLRANPADRAAFDAKYGAGAAARALGR